MKVRPLNDRIIVKRLEEEGKTKGGIIIPDSAKEKPVEGKVIAVGDGRINKEGKKIPMEIKKGDVIFVAAMLRAAELAPGAQAGVIAELGVHLAGAPYTAIATSSASLPKGQWIFVYASGVAAADYAPGSVGFGLQLGSSQQTIDVGPVYVLDLGPGIDTAALPNNFGSP